MPALPTSVDIAPLSGLTFGCQPDCGLCCYATPLVTRSERTQLIQIDPAIPFLSEGAADSRISDRGDGGACYLLRRNRCAAHRARPFPCREFPLSVHIGTRVQVAAVLSCPGLELAGFLGWVNGRAPTPPPEGFRSELEAVAAELDRPTVARISVEAERRFRSLARRLERRGLWSEPEEIRTALRPSLVDEVRKAYAPASPPEAADGVAALPLLRDRESGLLAIAGNPGGWAILAASEQGDEPKTLAVLPVPTRCPPIDASGERALRAYLEYLLHRDLTYGQAAWRIDPDGEEGMVDVVRSDLAEFGGLVLARGAVLRRLHGHEPGPLDAATVLAGVRATDAEFVDRPTLGIRL